MKEGMVKGGKTTPGKLRYIAVHATVKTDHQTNGKCDRRTVMERNTIYLCSVMFVSLR